MKKTMISLFLAMTFIISMSVSVFAVDEIYPHIIVRNVAEQAVSR